MSLRLGIGIATTRAVVVVLAITLRVSGASVLHLMGHRVSPHRVQAIENATPLVATPTMPMGMQLGMAAKMGRNGRENSTDCSLMALGLG
jgi:hypothetical protein